jgi:hypothetical protein
VASPRRALGLTLRALTCAALVLPSCGSDESDGGQHSTGGTGGVGGDPLDFVEPTPSCVYKCPGVQATCEESSTPYSCQNLGAWNEIPHADACPAWDGKYPDPVSGACTASAPSGEAAKYAGPDPDSPSTHILPDGRLLVPAGQFTLFSEPELHGGFTMGLAAVPGTSLVLTLDTGSGVHVVRAVDTALVGASDPVKSYVRFDKPEFLNGGIVFVPPDLVLVGTANGRVQALSLDTQTGVLTRDDARSVTLPQAGSDPYFVAGVAVSADGQRLVVSGVNDSRAIVLDLAPGTGYGAELGEVDVGSDDTFGAYFDPNDPTGSHAYVSLWKSPAVVDLDLADPANPVVSRSFTTEKDPQGVAFLDARWMVVANDLGETLTVVDRTSGDVTPVPIDYDQGIHGLDLSGVAWDAASHRLYTTLAGIDTIGALDVDLSKSPPSFTPVGRLPAGWWPSGAVVHEDGSLTVTSMRGTGAGPVDSGTQEGSQRGGVQHVPAPSAADLVAGEKLAHDNVEISSHPGYPAVSCPPGADDFPLPTSADAGPSKQITHVIFVVRENKTFDGVFGDVSGLEGEPGYVIKPGSMDQIWLNFRELARQFTNLDNSYTEADASIQGHAWTVYGRTTDYCERNWGTHARPALLGCGVTSMSKPEEGSLFDWLGENSVVYDILGEIVGNPKKVPPGTNPIDAKYPGGPFQAIAYPDNEKACYAAGRIRVLCDLHPFVYMTLPNDHGQGLDPNNPTPETMIAVNDEATGMLVDAVSHSPLWPSTLIIITEDDPQQGGDHIDYHRVPTVFISPWVKRGYVSKTHISIAGLHKIFAHVLGIPYPNLEVKNAALPYDAFTSTPDYTPFSYTPRKQPLTCGDAATGAEKELSASWQYDRADNQPGLDAQVMRWMRGQQLTELTPELREDIARRKALAARRVAEGLPAADDDD